MTNMICGVWFAGTTQCQLHHHLHAASHQVWPDQPVRILEVNQTIFRTDLNFLTLSRRKRIPGGFSTSTTSTATSQCSLPGPDIAQSRLDNEKCSQDQPPSLLCVGDGGGGGDDGGVCLKKIPPKVAPKPRHSLIIQLAWDLRR